MGRPYNNSHVATLEEQDEQRASAVLACSAERPAQAPTAYAEQAQPLLWARPLVLTECSDPAPPADRGQVAG